MDGQGNVVMRDGRLNARPQARFGDIEFVLDQLSAGVAAGELIGSN
jgi:hypothetical protein